MKVQSLVNSAISYLLEPIIPPVILTVSLAGFFLNIFYERCFMDTLNANDCSNNESSVVIYAGFWRRVLAYIIDMFVLLPIAMVAGFFFDVVDVLYITDISTTMENLC